MTDHHVAQLNVGRLVAPVESEEIAGFVARLDEINALAEASPGFVWRLVGADNNATDIHVTDDPLFIINLSVWRSMDELYAFAYHTAHMEVFRQRRAWFEAHVEHHLVAWWIPAGHIPTTEEALDRLATLNRDGPTPEAFTLKRRFERPASAASAVSVASAPRADPAA